MDYDYLKVSDGTGDVALMHVDAVRAALSDTLVPDTTDNVPDKFIATTGTLGSNNLLNPALPITVFLGHLDSGNIIIDSFAPGSTDVGNVETEVIIIKPNTTWANKVAEYMVRQNITSIASSGTPSPDADSEGKYFITALAANATFAAPAGTPIDGQALLIRIKDNGTSRTLAWNAAYRAVGVPLPGATVIGKTMYCGFMYNSAASKWDLIALSQEA